MLNLVLVLLPSHPSYFEVPSEVLAKVYSNSMMAVLNSRMRLNTEDFAARDASEIGPIRGLTDNHKDTDNTSQISGGILVTRERVVFPDADAKYVVDDRSSAMPMKYVNVTTV